jgi:uncharacterized protein
VTDEIHIDTQDTIREDGTPPKPQGGKLLIDLLDFQWKAELTATDVARNSHDHGPRHWRDVARVGLTILRKMEATDEMGGAVFCFAAIHDTQRENEYYDPEHGARAATVMHRLAPPSSLLRGGVEHALALALHGHDAGQNLAAALDGPVHSRVDHTLTMIQGVCWDADRLTIKRVGIEPEVGYMSTPIVRREFDAFVEMADAIRTGPDKPWQEIATEYAAL